MSTVLDFPPLDTAPVPALAAPVSIKATVLAQFAATEASLHTLAAKYRDVAYNVSTPKGLTEAKAARHDLRENGRFLVERAEKRIKAEVNDLKRTMADEVDRLVAIVRPAEDAIDAQIKVREEAIAAEKAERDRLEAERRAAHEARISMLRSFVTRCQAPGMTAERIAAGMAMLDETAVDDERDDFAADAARVKAETRIAMMALHSAAAQREAAAAAAEAQRVENARVAAELAAERKRIADEAAAIKAQAAELQRKVNEQAEKEAKAERDAAAVLAAQQAESERLEALAVAQREAQAREETDALVAGIRANSRRVEWPMNPAYIEKAMGAFECMAPDWQDDPRAEVRAAIAEGREYLAGLLQKAFNANMAADAPNPCDDEPYVDTYLPPSEPAVAYEAPAALKAAAEPEPLFVTLDSINDAIGEGFYMRADFISETLGIHATATCGADTLYNPVQRAAILRALAAHVEALA